LTFGRDAVERKNPRRATVSAFGIFGTDSIDAPRADNRAPPEANWIASCKGATPGFVSKQNCAPLCQHIRADAVDARVVGAFFEVLSPAELNLYAEAVKEELTRSEKLQMAQRQQCERCVWHDNQLVSVSLTIAQRGGNM
jgi:hypothetical protein